MQDTCIETDVGVDRSDPKSPTLQQRQRIEGFRGRSTVDSGHHVDDLRKIDCADPHSPGRVSKLVLDFGSRRLVQQEGDQRLRIEDAQGRNPWRGTSWQLASFTTRDPVAGADVPAAERPKYTVSFAAGGTFSATADCNIVTGPWAATGAGGLSIVPGPSTIVACGDRSYGDLYILALSNSASYAIANDGLTITLKDGGTLVYEPGG